MDNNEFFGDRGGFGGSANVENGAAHDMGQDGAQRANSFINPAANVIPAIQPGNMPVKKKRRGLRTAIAVVCCLALMVGSGFAGAKIIEGRYSAQQQQDSEVAQAHSSAGNERGGSNRDDGSISNGSGSRSDSGISNDSAGGDNNISNDNGGGAGDSGNSSDSSSIFEPLSSINPDGDVLSLTELFIGADPAVVAISTETTGRNAFGSIVTLPAAGSGFIISADGYIVTNNHVVEGATAISVLLNDGATFPAELVGRDPVSDIAVLKIDAKGLSYLTWGDSDNLQVGEQVAAIGNPLGEFANSMTVGYISALDREINIDGTPRNMLQTDAAVNSGNSGGPLLNLKGQVIGVVTAKSSGSNVEGLGFAIPSSKAVSAVKSLISIGASDGFGYVRKQAIIGVSVSTYEDDDQPGVRVESVNSGGAAEKAGIEEGDVIISANGAAVATVNELKSVINDFFPGDKLVLTILRDGAKIDVTVILDEAVPSDSASSMPYYNQIPNFPDDGSEMPFDPDSMFPGFWEQSP